MPLIAKSSGNGDFEPLSAGMHHAVCYGIVDLGTQPSNSPQFKDTRKVAFLWEVPAERIELEKDGRKQNLPRGISGMWTLSLSPKSKMRPVMESWRGKPFTEEELEGFDLKNVLGANCFLNVVHKSGTGQNAGKIYGNVASVNPLPKSSKKIKAENPMVFFSLEEQGDKITFPPTLPEWLQNKIKMSHEWVNMHKDPNHDGPSDQELANVSSGPDEDVPF